MSKSSHREVKQQLTEKSSAAIQGIIKLAACLQEDSGAEVRYPGSVSILAQCEGAVFARALISCKLAPPQAVAEAAKRLATKEASIVQSLQVGHASSA